jgi:hypothetical protein
MGKEADFAETMLQKFEKAILARMDQGEAVNKKNSTAWSRTLVSN